jgi:hypothetical protein
MIDSCQSSNKESFTGKKSQSRWACGGGDGWGSRATESVRRQSQSVSHLSTGP